MGGGTATRKSPTKTGVSPALVTAIRDEAFGPLKEPPEIAALSGEIAALEQRLLSEAAELRRFVDATIEPIKTELGGLKERHAQFRRTFAA
jgi:hypothetical protein